MEQNIKIISATRNPDPAVVELATWGQWGIVLLLLCLVIYIVLIADFIKQLKHDNPTLWQSAGYPTLLKNNRGLFRLIFAKLSKKLPPNLQKKAKYLRYLTYIIVFLILLLMLIFYFMG